jgi:hypothetical protein
MIILQYPVGFQEVQLVSDIWEWKYFFEVMQRAVYLIL